MGSSILRFVVSSRNVGRDDSLVTCNMPLYAAVTKDTILKTATTMSRLFGIDPNSESTCNTILIRNSSNYRNYVDFRRSTSDGHPMPTGTCLFPTCCCSIMFRLVCCFGYSWCVARLMRPGPGPDWSWPTKDVSNLHVCTRYEFFQDHINKENSNICCFDKMFVFELGMDAQEKIITYVFLITCLFELR